MQAEMHSAEDTLNAVRTHQRDHIAPIMALDPTHRRVSLALKLMGTQQRQYPDSRFARIDTSDKYGSTCLIDIPVTHPDYAELTQDGHTKRGKS
jgi:hypothetical protein